MGTQLLEWMRQPRETVYFDFAQSADFLEERFGNNIEDLFNGVQTEIDERRPGYSLFTTTHKPCLVEAMREWFAEIHQQNHAHSYEQFALEVVEPGDRIITFNYDLSLDAKMRQSGKWCIGDGYGFTAEGLPTGSTVSILKLHGSINWFAVLFGGMRGGPFALRSAGALGKRPAFTDTDLAALGYADLLDPLFPRQGAAAISPLILPTNRKQFFFETSLGREWESFWNRLWAAARRAVHTSDRVVICGYGMSPVDRRGCNLLLKGDLTAQMEVCCGGESDRIVQQLRNQGRNARKAEETFFEAWVSSQIQAERSIS